MRRGAVVVFEDSDGRDERGVDVERTACVVRDVFAAWRYEEAPLRDRVSIRSMQ